MAYSAESVERALTLHLGKDGWQKIETQRTPYVVLTHLGYERFSLSAAYAYVVGIAHGKKLEHLHLVGGKDQPHGS